MTHHYMSKVRTPQTLAEIGQVMKNIVINT